MEKLIFATHNPHKAREIRETLKSRYDVISLEELGINEDIAETGDTLEANALIKARYVYNKTGKPCFADDTGLEVKALNGAPGVYSARYAGEKASFDDNMDKLLKALESKTDRRAQFRTVIAFINEEGEEQLFEGKVLGSITKNKKGEKGFGYDPIFLPEGYNLSFAEMSVEEKNEISHRGRAVREFVSYLKRI